MRKFLMMCLVAGLPACASVSDPLPSCSQLGCPSAPWGEFEGGQSSWTPCQDPDLCYCPSEARRTPEAAACRPEAPAPTGDGHEGAPVRPVTEPGPFHRDECCSDDPPDSCYPRPGECVEYTCGAGFCNP